jgi:hypothetical protein
MCIVEHRECVGVFLFFPFPFTCGRRFPIRSATYLCPSICPRSLSNQTKRMYQTPMSQGRDRDVSMGKIQPLNVQGEDEERGSGGGPSIGNAYGIYSTCTYMYLLGYFGTLLRVHVPTLQLYVCSCTSIVHTGTIHYCRETCKYGERELGYIYMGLVNVWPPVLQGTSSTCLPETRNKSDS